MLEQTNPELYARFKADFPGLSEQFDGTDVTYLDNAATTLKPKAMVEAMNQYYLGISSNIHRGKYVSLESVSDRYENVRSKVANLIGAIANEVVFLRNTTEAINLVARGLGLDKSDKVVLCAESHHSNMLPWMENATVDFVSVTETGQVSLEHYHELLKQHPKVVALTHCANTTGVYLPLEQMVKAAKAIGAVVVVDGAQSVPHRKIDVKALGIDFLAFSAHKMVGPTGLGVLYGDRSQLEKLAPLNLGGGCVDWVDFNKYRLRKIPHRFEAGTPHIAGVLGLGASIDYLNEIGFDVIEQHDKAMGQRLLSLATQYDYLKVLNADPELDRGAVISVSIPGVDNLDDVARYLSDSYGIMCRNGHLCAQPYVSSQSSGQVLRASGYFYNTEAQLEAFFEALDQIVSFIIPR